MLIPCLTTDATPSACRNPAFGTGSGFRVSFTPSACTPSAWGDCNTRHLRCLVPRLRRGGTATLGISDASFSSCSATNSTASLSRHYSASEMPRPRHLRCLDILVIRDDSSTHSTASLSRHLLGIRDASSSASAMPRQTRYNSASAMPRPRHLRCLDELVIRDDSSTHNKIQKPHPTPHPPTHRSHPPHPTPFFFI